jgi:flagellar biogenesis protein FliO
MLSFGVLLLPVFWSPVNNQPITPLPAVSTQNVTELMSTPLPAKPPAAGGVPVVAAAEEAAAPVPTPVIAAAPEPVLPPTPQAPAVEEEISFGDDRAVAQREPAFDFAAQLRRTVLSLLGVTVLIGVTLKLMQRHLPGFGGAAQKKSWMNVLAREAVGPNQSLALIQAGPKILLVGMSEQNMTTLCEYTQAEVAEMLETPPVAQPVTAAGETAQSVEPKKVYGDILRHYLSIVPGMGTKK